MRKVPKLRFKEFSDEWEEKKLGEIIKQLNAGISVNSNEQTQINSFTKAILKTSCICNGKFIEEEAKKILSEEINKVKLFAQKGQILISRMNTPQLVGAVTYIEKDFPNRYLPDRIWQTEFKNKEYDGKYLAYLLNTPKYNFKIRDLATGTSNSMKNISKENFLSLSIFIPLDIEQQKITNFLSSIDKKISLTEEKLELFREYKKGVMQKIFSQELRFKDSNGNDYPEWNLVYTKDISKITMGFTPSTKDEKMWNGQYKWLSIADLKENGKYIYKTSKTITDKGIKNKKILSKGTLVMSFKLTLGRVGILADNMFTNEAICHFHWLEKDKINTEYIYYYLSNIDIINFGKQAVKGITLNTESLNSIEVQLPCYEEQQKIADFLSSIDSKIESIEKELDRLKEFKRGLLQQMFI